MDRYLLIIVDRRTGDVEKVGPVEGEEGAIKVWTAADKVNTDPYRCAIVVGLRPLPATFSCPNCQRTDVRVDESGCLMIHGKLRGIMIQGRCPGSGRKING